MKKLIYKIYYEVGREKLIKCAERLFVSLTLIVTFIACIISCSPQKQLADILLKHPELQRDSVVKIHKVYVQQAQTSATNFTINDLKALTDSAHQCTLDTAPETAENNYHQPISISANTSGCSANITANANGSFNLNIKQKPDTIHITDSIKVPVYYTDTQYVIKEVNVLSKNQKFFYNTGITFWTALAILILVIILSRIYQYKKLH